MPRIAGEDALDEAEAMHLMVDGGFLGGVMTGQVDISALMPS